MNALTTLEDFIMKVKAQKVLTIISHTMQVTQAMNHPKVKPKIVFYL
jgi:hypothetical protein